MTKDQIELVIKNSDELINNVKNLEKDIGEEFHSIFELWEGYLKNPDIFKQYNLNEDIIMLFGIIDEGLEEVESFFEKDKIAEELVRNIIDVYENGNEAYAALEALDLGEELFPILNDILTEPNQKNMELAIRILKEEYDNAYRLDEISSTITSLNLLNNNLDKIKDELPEAYYLVKADSKESMIIWEQKLKEAPGFIYDLPDEKIVKDMPDEEYNNWKENLIISVLNENFDKLSLSDVIDKMAKTTKIWEKIIEVKRGDYSIDVWINEIPRELYNRKIFELLLQESDERSIEKVLNMIPNETFEKGLSQKDYSTWLDDIITRKISEIEDINKVEIPSFKVTERVWNCLLDRCNEKNADVGKCSLRNVAIQNITKEMCKRAIQEIGILEVYYLPSIDRKTDLIQNEGTRETYKNWIEHFSEKEKQEYRRWYEDKVISFIKTKNGVLIFSDNLEESEKNGDRYKFPPESISVNIINEYLNIHGILSIENIPLPSKFTNYNKQQYEEIIISELGKEKNKGTIISYDVLKQIPKEYITDSVIMAAIKITPKYLDYADIESDNFEDFLQIAYKNKLESLGRTTLSNKEIELMKKFARNNSSLFSTFSLEIFTPEIISSINENIIEKIVRYKGVQNIIEEVAENRNALIVFKFVLENLQQDSLFIEPFIEQLGEAIKRSTKKKDGGFLEYAADRIESNRINSERCPMLEEEKIIISYLALNPQEANKIQDYDEIKNFVTNKNAELDGIISNQDVTLIEAKNAYFERIVGMDYSSILDLIKKYGNDPEQLLAKYEGRELESYKEKSEKESLEIITKLKSLVQETDLSKIRQAYKKAVEKEDKTKAFERYRYSYVLNNTLKRAYGRDIAQILSDNNKENNIESIEHTKDGQEYVVKKLNGPFNRMISIMNAYRKSKAEAEGDMYDRWNTSEMAQNHALCYSFINESNPGTVRDERKKGIIISISGFDAEAVTAVAPYDLCSNSEKNTTTITGRQQIFYTADNLPDQTRGAYSEIVIELQDVSKDVTEYKKIQPTSIICFEKIDEDSINAAIELSKKLGRIIPIELIDRRELASKTRTEIDNLLKQLISGESIQPELVEEVITKFNNVRNAHMHSDLREEIWGSDEDPEAPFNKVHLNTILSECIDSILRRMENGQTKQGLKEINQIKEIIKREREKNILIETSYIKQKWSGIDLSIDYKIDEIQRTYGEPRTRTGNFTSESIEALQTNQEMQSTITYEECKKKWRRLPEQLSLPELKKNIDIENIKNTAQEIYQSGYYSENMKYSEEHIIRVAMFSNAIANLEGSDDKTKQLLQEAVKYYACGMVLDNKREEHQEYSAKIAGEELEKKYPQTDVGIIQAAIELQGFIIELQYEKGATSRKEEQKREKITELCNKYGLDIKEEKKIDTISKYLNDAISLDETRFLPLRDEPTGEVFSDQNLITNTAVKLIKCSYDLQEQLSSWHLNALSRVAHVDYEGQNEKNAIKNAFFLRGDALSSYYIFGDKMTESPIIREAYFKKIYEEIHDPVKVGKELEKKQKNILTRDTTEMPIYTEQQIGKATINVSTTSKDAALNRQQIDTRVYQREQEEI